MNRSQTANPEALHCDTVAMDAGWRASAESFRLRKKKKSLFFVLFMAKVLPSSPAGKVPPPELETDA